MGEYERYIENFKKALTANISQSNTNNSKYNNALLDIVKTLYRDVSRDKLFLKNEKIRTDKWEDINLNENPMTSESEEKFSPYKGQIVFN